jgi:hypothetical protein
MRYIFIHCVVAKNRTPAAAAGYFKFVASRDHTRDPPQIVAIEGGFDAFKNTPGSENRRLLLFVHVAHTDMFWFSYRTVASLSDVHR